MEYQALYRKYRPQLFEEVVGQSHVTNTLVREIAEGKVAHAYLFAGPRGTGKTTSARLLAKSLNCQNPPGGGEPCNACDSCLAIVNGSSFDVTELDAASHNSVDDIRDIKVSVTTVASVGGAKRVFILDEAHMLSKAASNALLKTLEEPPEHVHFVLATTEPYKLLDTIRSRSQRFDFHPVSVEALTEHLAGVAKLESYTVAEGALQLVARHAAGSVRDSLSLLEQVAALGDGSVDPAAVNRALGLADRDVFARLAIAVGEHDARTALELVATLAGNGVDLRRFISEAIAFFRGVFLAHYAPNLEEVADEPADILADWRAVAATLSVGDVIRSMDVLSDGLLRLREGREERLMTEITLLKLTRPEIAADVPSIQARLDTLERRVSAIARQAPTLPVDAVPAPTPRPSVPAGSPRSSRDAEQSAEERTAEAPPGVVPASSKPEILSPEPSGSPASVVGRDEAPTGDVDLAAFKRIWPALSARIKDELGNRRHALFREARPGLVDGATLIIHVPSHLGFHLEQMVSDPQFAAAVSAEASSLLGGSVAARFVADNADQASPVELGVDDDDDEETDKDRMAEAGEVDDPVGLVEDLLGGEVIEES
ncbi:MAG: DNA polymerase III subunit gamma/tau [Acidimicrobiia bacterium]|nr:DNA polymerase III subunit gamma/tau [Acidimicrobiia bacterium]